MHVVHTAAEPPNHGRICLAMSGWTWKSRNALRKIVSAKKGLRGLLVSTVCRDTGNSFSNDKGVDMIRSLIRFDGLQIA